MAKLATTGDDANRPKEVRRATAGSSLPSDQLEHRH
jgi:hypothetical protein